MSTVDKALEVLSLFSELRPSVGLSEAARLLGRDKSTTQRYLASLEAQGFLEQDALSRAYHLGPAVTRLAAVRELTYPVETAVKNIVKKLVKDIDETVHVTHVQANGLSSVCVVETTKRNTRVYIDPAEVLPLHLTASGIVYLSQLSRDQADKELKAAFADHMPVTGVTIESAKQLILAAAASGYSVANATFDYDVVGMAAPLFRASGGACGAISITTPTARFDADAQARNVEFLLPAAEKISRVYGALPTQFQAAAE